jgi:hypothetical protein
VVIVELFDFRIEEFNKLKTNLAKLQKRIEKIEQDIEKSGVDAYYSINDEILEYAMGAYTSLRTLGYIKNFIGENNE